jgi:hypothetical protein
MGRRTLILVAVAGAVAAGGGCEQLPGKKREQGAVIGGVGGAAVGAAVAKDNRLLGALIGGALGAGGGYLIGAQMEKVKNNEGDAAVQSARNGEQNPATPEQARNASTADINSDGFVTLDEVIAMKKAGFSDDEMLRRLRATNQIFELTSEQEQTLRNNGVSQNLINQMREINRAQRDELLKNNSVVSRPKQ